jgi:hypothetical protein
MTANHPYYGSPAAATIGMAAIGAIAAGAAGSYGYHDSGEAASTIQPRGPRWN